MEIIGTAGLLIGLMGFVIWLFMLSLGPWACHKSEEHWLNRIAMFCVSLSAIMGYIALLCMGLVLWGFIFNLVLGG